MVVYRTAKAPYVSDLSGIGAEMYGGRWNPKGIRVVYASESRALAILEFLVHQDRDLIPRTVHLAAIEISDHVSVKHIDPAELPGAWRSYPFPPTLPLIGAQWARSRESLLLRVPSAVVPAECNVLVNPLHPEMRHVRVGEIEEYRFDDRLR